MGGDMTGLRPGAGGAADDLIGADEARVMLTAAAAGPSLHNSQPWAFAVGARHIEVYADASRQLTQADPTGRGLLISCGAALFNLRVAAEHLGFHPRVRLLPRDQDLTLVAVVDVDHRHAGPSSLGVYYDAVPLRRTNRRPFRNRRIPAAVTALLTEAVRAEGALLRVYEDPLEVERLVDLLNDANRAEHVDPGRIAEHAAWVGVTDRDDGIPVQSLGPRPRDDRTAYRDLGYAVQVAREEAAFESAPTVAVISTEHDRPVDWLRAGQALERLLLEATRAGVAASFFNQSLEQPDLRWLVRNPVSGIGHSHMLLRLGYGEEVPPTPRRPIEQLMRPPQLTRP